MTPLSTTAALLFAVSTVKFILPITDHLDFFAF
jgi:hypothetical protein